MTSPVRSFALLAACVSGLAVTTPSRAAETYKVDAVHSSVVYRVKHLNTSYHWGRFNDISGTFALDPASPEQSKLQFAVKASSIDSGNANRDQHLKGPDFFNAVQFPTIAFTSKSVTKSNSGYEVSGDLTLHGVTKPVTLRVTPVGTGKDMRGKAIAGIETTFTVSQKDFGITKMAAAVGDDVLIIVCVEGVRQ